MAKTFIRWMEAFGSALEFKESLEFEITRRDTAACEEVMTFNGKLKALVPLNHSRVKVGCLVNPARVYRRFQHDCRSKRTSDGKLVTETTGKGGEVRTADTRHHTEAWLDASKGCYVLGFVVYGNLERLDGKRRGAIRKLSTQYGLPVYELFKGKLIDRGVISPDGAIPSKGGDLK